MYYVVIVRFYITTKYETKIQTIRHREHTHSHIHSHIIIDSLAMITMLICLDFL